MDSVIESTSFMCIDKWCLRRRLNPKSMHDSILEFFLKWNKWKFRLKVRLGYDPSDEQLASSLRIPRTELRTKMIECSLARDKLAMSNVRLVMSIAQKYDKLGAEMADLVQVLPLPFWLIPPSKLPICIPVLKCHHLAFLKLLYLVY